MIPIDLAQVATNATGTAIALAIMWGLIQGNKLRVKHLSSDIRRLDKGQERLHERVTAAEDCFESELKEVRRDVSHLCSNTKALIQHQIATDREEHPDAVKALETVLRNNGG